MSGTRTETDSIGAVEVPADAYWGAQTERSRHNFPFPAHERMPLPIVHALARIKGAAARVNRAHGLDEGLAAAIAAAADAVAAGNHDDQFPLATWQTGSGTQSNMNANEVIANRWGPCRGGTRASLPSPSFSRFGRSPHLLLPFKPAPPSPPRRLGTLNAASSRRAAYRRLQCNPAAGRQAGRQECGAP